ncbi:MAG: CHAT domain-containing protein, partial [Rhodanobacter sp.]
ALQPGEVLVDVAIEDDGLAAYRVGTEGFEVVFEPMDVATLAAPELVDVRQRQPMLLALVRTHAGLAQWATRVTSDWAHGRNLLLVPDGPLYNLPLHEIRIGDNPWHTRQPIGLLPCAAWLLRAARMQSRACLVAGNSAGDLHGAESECAAVANELGTTALTGARCSRAALETALQSGPLDIVHLAVHGRGDTQQGVRASLLLADGLDGTEWVPFEALAQRQWQANLVVLSGCSTGVSGPLHGHEMVSVARAALESGAASVLASLWPVADQAAAAFMVAFHESVAQQRRHGDCDLRMALDEARRSVLTQGLPPDEIGQPRDGRGVDPTARGTAVATSQAVAGDGLDAVAAFVLIGRPTLDRQGLPEEATPAGLAGRPD